MVGRCDNFSADPAFARLQLVMNVRVELLARGEIDGAQEITAIAKTRAMPRCPIVKLDAGTIDEAERGREIRVHPFEDEIAKPGFVRIVERDAVGIVVAELIGMAALEIEIGLKCRVERRG